MRKPNKDSDFSPSPKSYLSAPLLSFLSKKQTGLFPFKAHMIDRHTDRGEKTAWPNSIITRYRLVSAHWFTGVSTGETWDTWKLRYHTAPWWPETALHQREKRGRFTSKKKSGIHVLKSSINKNDCSLRCWSELSEAEVKYFFVLNKSQSH